MAHPDGRTVTLDAEGLTLHAPHPGDAAEGAPQLPGRYQLQRLLGAGGMGEVHSALDGAIGRVVALKTLRRGHRSEWARERFLEEARVQGQLEHPSVVPVYDLAEAADVDFFTMKRIEGLTLAAAIDRGEAPLHRLLAAFQQVCLCVDYAHSRGVLHRDLKPENVMLGAFGEVYVLDWGIAKIAGRAERASLELPASRREGTIAGAVVGTPGYLAPEVIRGEPASRASDVFSLGAVLFEILSGEPLYPQESVEERLHAALTEGERRPSTRAPERNVPPELDELALAATAPLASARPPSARALHDALERFLAGDRDLALRRALAEEHSRRATEMARQALEAPGDEGALRSAALREIGRALALDPSSETARDALHALLATPPRTPPREAVEELCAVEEQEGRSAAAIAAWTLAALSALVCFTALEVPAGSLVPVVAPGALAALSARRAARRPDPAAAILAVLLGSMAIAAASGFLGPLVVTPGLAGGCAVLGLVMLRDDRLRALSVGCCLLAVVAPALLEISGLFPSSYRNTDGAITIVSRFLRFPERRYPFAVLGACVVTIVAPAAVVWSLLRRNAELRTRLSVLTWHLTRLSPGHGAAPPSA